MAADEQSKVDWRDINSIIREKGIFLWILLAVPGALLILIKGDFKLSHGCSFVGTIFLANSISPGVPHSSYRKVAMPMAFSPIQFSIGVIGLLLGITLNGLNL